MIFYTVAVAFVWLTVKHSLRSALLLAVLPYTLFIGFRYTQYRRHVKLLAPLPIYGPWLLTPFASIWSMVLPHIKWICFEQNPSDNEVLYARRAAVYDAGKSTNMVVGSILPPAAALHTSDEVTLAFIYSDRFTFQKPLYLYERFALYGESILCTELDQWKRHKRIVVPAFGESTHELAWTTTTRIMRTWMGSLAKSAANSKDGLVRVDDVKSLTLHMALSILSEVAFGMRIACPGEPDDKVPANHPYSLRDTLEGSLRYLFITLAAPSWLRALPIGILKKAKMFKDEQTQYLREFIAARRKAMRLGEDKKDVLSQLIKFSGEAKDFSDSKVEPLTEDELFGNMFTFLVAGHVSVLLVEAFTKLTMTTGDMYENVSDDSILISLTLLSSAAHTLAFALGRLALNPHVQDWLYEQLSELMPDPAVDVSWTKETHAVTDNVSRTASVQGLCTF